MLGISIIVTFYQGISSLNLCLSTLLASLQKEDAFEVIVVNDNPAISLHEISTRYPVKLVNMPENQGYAAAVNYGVSKAAFDTLVLMDCDIYPMPGWLLHMKNAFHDIEGEGCVSATIYEAGSGLLFGYGMGVYETDILLYLRHGKPTGFIEQDRDFPIISSGCMMVGKKLYLDYGGQDEKCVNTHCDVDFTLRLFEDGYHNRLCSKAIVYHLGQVSGDIRRIPFRNDVKAYLFSKWGTRMTALCDAPKMLKQVWSNFDGGFIKGCNVIVVCLSNSLYRREYVYLLAGHFHFDILQFHDVKNINGATHIMLQEHLSWDICRTKLPIVYFVDDYRILENNYYWRLNRAFHPDLLGDKNGNLIKLSFPQKRQ